jgi:hypothetical protein
MTRCPSDLELERLAQYPAPRGTPDTSAASPRSTDPGEPAASHLFSCARCAARLAELRRLGEEFEREVFPATVEAVVARDRRPRSRAVWLVPAAAAAVLVALAVRWVVRDDARAAALDLLAWADADVAAIADGQRIPAGAGLRFEIRPPQACTLWMASADAAGNVKRIFPPKALTGTKGLPVEAGRTVAVNAPAPQEGNGGPERYFAVCLCGDDSLEWKDVDRAARTIGAGGAKVRGARTIPGLPGDTLQATLLVERER